jgi:septal ring factor EnvC (AmiA/AmiB activator)
VERDGTYRKGGRRKITQPVTRVPPESLPDPDFLQEVDDAVKHLDKDRIVMRRSTGGIVALLVLAALGGMGYVGAKFFTREHQLDHLRQELREVGEDVEQVQLQQQALERRLVELETDVESLQERR